jgi:pimeloyl-ACP methyl ester carboxylesterase
MSKAVHAGVLEISYLESGDADGWPVVLSHGFPFDVHAYDEVASHLAQRGARVIVPYLARIWANALPLSRHAA